MGALTGDLHEEPPDNPREAVDSSSFHTWVEIPDEQYEYIVVEVATEWNKAPGLPYIAPSRPDEYYVPDGARFYYEDWMDQTIVGVPSRIDEFLNRAQSISDCVPTHPE